MNENEALLEGYVSIQAALSARSRAVREILIDKTKRGSRDAARLQQLAKKSQANLRYVGSAEIDEVSSGRSHGGMLAIAGPRNFVELKELVRSEQPFVVMLDGVEDPFTLGYSIRAVYAAGADGLVIRGREWLSATPVIARASAGASELIATATTEGPDEAAAFFRAEGLRICATAAGEGSESVYDADWTRAAFILIGGERRGIKRAFLDKADAIYHIPYGRTFNRSLGTVSAATLIAFEVARQRAT